MQPGCHLPWRVIHLKREHTKLPKDEKGAGAGAVPTATGVTYTAGSQEREPLSRKKPGKKRRIQLRKRAVVAGGTKATTKETDAEKRNRKNRERKIKRRQKAREQKAAVAAEGGDGAVKDLPDEEGSEQDSD